MESSRVPFSFVAFIACLMGLSALGIDAILPAYNHISADFQLKEHEANNIQYIVYLFFLGFATTPIIFGVLADIWGRKPTLLLGLLIFFCSSVWAVTADSFTSLLCARFFQGVGLASPRVLTVTLVRDRASGKEMARIMSFTTMIFLLVPMLAPALGSVILYFSEWQMIFYCFMLIAFMLILWTQFGLQETVRKDNPMRADIRTVLPAISACFRYRRVFSYLMMFSLIYSTLVIYIGLAEPILQTATYAMGHWFPLFFAMISCGMIASAYTNSRLVLRYGLNHIIRLSVLMMLISDSLLAVISLIYHGVPPLWLFITHLLIHFYAFGLIMPNLNALMMEPMRKIAGTASAVIGTISTALGVLCASLVGHYFNGTVYPLALSFCLFSLTAWLIQHRVLQMIGREK